MSSGILISNYTPAVRTNAVSQTAGLQTTCLSLDKIGIVASYDASALHFYGDGFIDTQWVPKLGVDFIAELGQYKHPTTADEFVGVSDIAPDRVFMGYSATGNAIIDVTTPIFNSPLLDGYHLLAFSATSATITAHIDGISNPPIPYTSTTVTKTFRLGTLNKVGNMFNTNVINHFAVLNKLGAVSYDPIQSYSRYLA